MAGAVGGAHLGAASTPPAASTGTRNAFLDGVRAIAIIRVLAWHTYGYAWISYFVASMPAMFFVAGSLMARSLDRGKPYQVLFSRFRRILVPLWVFGVIALSTMAAYSARNPGPAGDVPWDRAWTWLVPAWDPEGSTWGITLWTTLWYLRCMAWLLVLSPVLLWLFRRVSVLTLLAPLVALAFFEYRRRQGDPVTWQLEDLALYSVFWLLGFAYNDHYFDRLPTVGRATAAFFAATAAAWWCLTQDVPGHIVNASYPAHLFVGLTWLFAALTIERPFGRLVAWERVSPAIYWINERAVTIYLWHAAGLFVMYQLIWSRNGERWVRDLVAFPIVLVVTFACVMAFGWIEDLAARRRPRSWPSRTPSAGLPRQPSFGRSVLRSGAMVMGTFAGITVVVMAANSVLHESPSTQAANGAHHVPPSGVGLTIRTARARIVDSAPAAAPQENQGPVTAAELQAVVERWAAQNGISGVIVAIETPDHGTWAGATGRNDLTRRPMTIYDSYNIASVTKTFTVALLMQLVEDGRISLDDPLSLYVPEFVYAQQVTLRELIQHSSGIVATDGMPPNEALDYVSTQPLAFEPGTSFEYSTPGYFLLGMVIENVLNEPYTQALHERLLGPLGLSHTFMDEELEPRGYSTHPYLGPYDHYMDEEGLVHAYIPQPPEGSKNFDYEGLLWSSAGIISTTEELAHWAIELWDTTDVVDEESRAAMTTFKNATFQYTGLATYPFCPCWMDGSALRGERWGHLGKTGVLEYDPRDHIALAIYTNETVLDEQVIEAYDILSVQLRALVRTRDLPSAAKNP